MRTLAVFDESHQTPRRRDERSRETRAVAADRRKDIRERRKQKKRSRRKQRRAARAGQLTRREVQRGQPQGIPARRDDPIRLRDVAADLSQRRHDRGQEWCVEELERESEIPVRVPGEIGEAVRNEACIRDECRLDAAAELREFTRKEWGDNPRLQSEESDSNEEIDREPTREGASLDARQYGWRA